MVKAGQKDITSPYYPNQISLLSLLQSDRDEYHTYTNTGLKEGIWRLPKTRSL